MVLSRPSIRRIFPNPRAPLVIRGVALPRDVKFQFRYEFSALSVTCIFCVTLPTLWERYFDLRARMFSTSQLCGGHRSFSLISATDVDPCVIGLFVYDQKQVPKNEQRADVVQLTSKIFHRFAVGSHATLIKWTGCQQWRSLIRCAHSRAPKIWSSAER